jgi:hypothetical protein
MPHGLDGRTPRVTEEEEEAEKEEEAVAEAAA